MSGTRVVCTCISITRALIPFQLRTRVPVIHYTCNGELYSKLLECFKTFTKFCNQIVTKFDPKFMFPELLQIP